MEPARLIAAGGQPAWTQEFDHPDHGKLTFTVPQMPRAKDWLVHAVAQEALTPGVDGRGPSTLSAAIAAMQTFMQVPVLSERREQDADNPDHVKLVMVKYDPLEDEHIEFVVTVWLSFVEWRLGLLNKVEEVKNSSGATSGEPSDGSSPDTTDSLPPTLP